MKPQAKEDGMRRKLNADVYSFWVASAVVLLAGCYWFFQTLEKFGSGLLAVFAPQR